MYDISANPFVWKLVWSQITFKRTTGRTESRRVSVLYKSYADVVQHVRSSFFFSYAKPLVHYIDEFISTVVRRAKLMDTTLKHDLIKSVSMNCILIQYNNIFDLFSGYKNKLHKKQIFKRLKNKSVFNQIKPNRRSTHWWSDLRNYLLFCFVYLMYADILICLDNIFTILLQLSNHW